ncbi:hypothetical protein [uncultured Chryseobacterium sp.]|uniref:hypothetical protein n=1 Tax=uncultured Chryseobacterium sp. TaxID=259322 RepID=UPI0025D102FC|nr:hypothetical protein [uncultured Chryseobacterium sp.]
MKIKFKNPVISVFLFVVSFFCLALPFLFYHATSFLKKGEYLWFLYFNGVFIFTIVFMLTRNYFELVRAEINDQNLIYHNFIFIQSSIRISKIKGYKIGISDDGKNFISIYDQDNKKLFVLKENYYSNIPEFTENMKIENIGIDFTAFQRIILRLKGKK